MDAGIGRFIAPDSVSPVDPGTSKTNESLLLNPQKLNRYSYGLNNPYRYVDLDGGWAEDVHSGINNYKKGYGTYYWARQVGFSDKEARIIARGDNGTDKNFGWAVILGVPGRHFNTSIPGSVDTREIFAKKDFQLAISLYRQGKDEEALAILGRGLHSLQDKIAHGDWPFYLRHPGWFDSAEKRPEELKQTGVITKEYLKQFRNLIRKRENE
jgi:hypothetical protein